MARNAGAAASTMEGGGGGGAGADLNGHANVASIKERAADIVATGTETEGITRESMFYSYWRLHDCSEGRRCRPRVMSDIL